jgi:glutamate-1-semialdehyde 2,1-aminomutase
MKGEKRHYEEVDMPIYHTFLSPYLPEKILDFHTHIWKSEHWKIIPWEKDIKGGRYMVVEKEYTAEKLISDMRYLFPDREYNCVCFGLPTPSIDVEKSNAYVIEKSKKKQQLFPLLVAGKGLISKKEIERAIFEKGFLGYKVFLPWQGDNYSNIKVEDMIGNEEMDIANRYGLIVLLHVPGKNRLADPMVQKSIRYYSKKYINAKIILAHCGRCYHPDDMFKAIKSIKDLENVYLDTAMVMEPMIFQILFSEIKSSRIIFGTDIPIALMRGRRVYVKDHWVDVVLKGYPPSAFRVEGDNFDATFMVYEIILAIIRAGKISGLSKEEISRIFHKNGFNLIKEVLKVIKS